MGGAKGLGVGPSGFIRVKDVHSPSFMLQLERVRCNKAIRPRDGIIDSCHHL